MRVNHYHRLWHATRTQEVFTVLEFQELQGLHWEVFQSERLFPLAPHAYLFIRGEVGLFQSISYKIPHVIFKTINFRDASFHFILVSGVLGLDLGLFWALTSVSH